MNRRTFFARSAEVTRSSLDFFPVAEEQTVEDTDRNRFMNKSLPALPRTLAGIEEYTGAWGFDQIAHVLRRTLFGFKRSEMETVKNKTMGEIVSMLLTDQPAPNPPVAPKDEMDNNVLVGVTAGNTWVNSVYNNNIDSSRNQQLQSWWLGLMLGQGISLVEKMTLFWHNHFSNEIPDVSDARFMYKQNALQRQYAFGNFKSLVKEITFDPAMIRYLNGNTNTKKSPNENYGRELQELFTIGKGPEISPGNYTNYTEDDVKAAARALTGWKDRRDPIGVTFTSSQHDSTDKTFSSAYGGTVIKGQTTEAGARKEADDLVDMIFAQAETSRYIVRKLYRWFVYYVIDAATEQNVIEPLAQILRTNNFEMKPVLAALFKSAHFYDPVNIGCVIKSPMDHIVGTLRAFNVVFPNATQLESQYNAWRYIVQYGATVQQTLLSPPNVAGWPAYWQEPVFYELWITSDTLPKRNAATDALVTGRTPTGGRPPVTIDVMEYIKLVSTPSDPNVVVDELSHYLLPYALSDTQKSDVKSFIVKSGQDYDWTNNWTKYIGNQMTNSEKTAFITSVQNMVKYVMNYAEYQLS